MFKLQPKKPFQSLLSRKSKKGTRNGASRERLWGVFRSWIFCRAISIQDPLNINKIENESSVWLITLTSNTLPISYEIEFGAKCNVVPFNIYEKLNPQPDLHPVNLKISSYINYQIPVIVKCSLTLENKNELFNVFFLIVDTKSVPILRLE